MKNAISLYTDELPEIIKFGRKPNPIDFTYDLELLYHDKFFSAIKKMSESELSSLQVTLEELENRIEPSFKEAIYNISKEDMELGVGRLEWTGVDGFIHSLKNIVCNKGMFEFSYLNKMSNKHGGLG